MPDALDRLIVGFDRALRTLAGTTSSVRASPAEGIDDEPLTAQERRHAGGLMRVNHTGEVCAQALYQAQAMVASDPEVRERFAATAREEEDHLAWTRARLTELETHASLANPLWYAGSFAIGVVAGLSGDHSNLGFVVETERQVEEHLSSHIDRLPAGDARSRAIVVAMRDDEIRHGMAATEAGARELPLPIRVMMRATARLMTVTAYRI